MDVGVKTAVSIVLGAVIGIVWVWFALLGIHTFGSLVSLFIAISVTILLGSIMGAVWVLNPKKS